MFYQNVMIWILLQDSLSRSLTTYGNSTMLWFKLYPQCVNSGTGVTLKVMEASPFPIPAWFQLDVKSWQAISNRKFFVEFKALRLMYRDQSSWTNSFDLSNGSFLLPYEGFIQTWRLIACQKKMEFFAEGSCQWLDLWNTSVHVY